MTKPLSFKIAKEQTTLYVHYIIFCKAIQKLFSISRPNHAKGVYIIRNLLRYIINAKHCISSRRRQNARWRVMIYKGGSPPLMICTALRAAMICQACGLDKQKQNICLPTNVLFLLARRKGFEPPTFWFVAKHSIQLS